MTQEEITQRAHARAREALSLRQKGLTYREIGERLGVKAERAAQMVAKGERLARTPREIAGLSVRALNYLKALGITSKAQARNADLGWMPNVGPKTVAEVRAWAASED
jgi:DNA-directed RNA polymerase alpha subunit